MAAIARTKAQETIDCVTIQTSRINMNANGNESEHGFCFELLLLSIER